MRRHVFALARPRCGIRVAQRTQVSMATLLDHADNVLPCYSLIQQQLQPQIAEEPRRCESSLNFVHSIRWSWDGKELVHEGSHRSKRGAKNEAARLLLKELASHDPELMNPGQNGALAQWAIERINQQLDASFELQEEEPAGAEGEGQRLRAGPVSHTCTWSCPQFEGETVVTGTGSVAAASRREAMAALYKSLPSNLQDVYLAAASVESKIDPATPTKAKSASREKSRLAEVNVMHNNVVQKMGIQANSTITRQPDGEFECALTWTFYDSQSGTTKTERVVAVASSKPAARGRANEQMLVSQGHWPRLTDENRTAIEEIKQSLKESRVSDASAQAQMLMESLAPDASAFAFFLPDVLRAILAEGNSGALHEMMAAILRSVQEHGCPVELWEALLDEASFSIRHYFMASSALEQLSHFPLADAFAGELEKEYFRRFRSLLALERHGSLIHGIQQYELDPDAHCSVPTVEVHHKEAAMVVLTTPPGNSIMELIEGARALKSSDIILLVPSEAAEERPPDLSSGEYFGELGNSSGWQHPEAWLAYVTSVAGNPRMGEEVRVNTRRISSFSSSVEGGGQPEDGAQPRSSPITLGRQFRLYYVAMETPLSRQFAALRCLTKVRMPAWSDGFEGRRPTYQYGENVRQILLGTAETARALSEERAQVGMDEGGAAALIQKLAGRYSWLASLAPSQHSAVGKALEHKLSLIQGPPGTGKTFVACAIVAAWLEAFSQFGERILAVADSNVAADNLYTRLQSFGIEAVRVGQGKEVESQARSADMLYKAAQGANVVIATCIGSGMEILNGKGEAGGVFRRVIVDECTQACEPAVLVALGRRAEQVVLIGDHAQLPATVLSKHAQREGLGLSLFERMVSVNGLPATVLTEQRRMHSSISDFPNHAFYAGQLVNAADDSALTAVPGFPWPNPNCRVCFVDVSSDAGSVEGRRGFSSYNPAEAEAVARTLDAIIRAGYPPQQIVVLTAYLAQKQEIARAMRERGLRNYLDVVSVDTVDGYQGMEQGLVLFSATRSNESRALGFLADQRRMNVMLTRAKQGLIVFGNADTLRHSDTIQSRWPSWLDWVEERGAVLSSSHLESSGGAQAAQAQGSWIEPRSQPSVSTSVSAWDDLSDLEANKISGGYDLPASQGARVTQTVPGDMLGASPVSQTASSPVDAFPPPPPTQSAPVWQQVYSEEHRAHYYWNKETNLTQWEAPASFTAAEHSA
eukprot:TRINITY_DN2770_c0_g1_i1.p1 TRINITY_DN2770_c0_g1~~TRINITY_DN2770_c0_g1_i1.p1  ORF type:complete len:1216 (+),score=190.45 TRINITY_DN2770_c0_g1_i1:71-3718(+)